jgi:hypothetical protein
MQDSNAVVKKIYCIVINGKIQEKLDFDSMEIAKDYIKLFSLKYRQENTIAIREIYREYMAAITFFAAMKEMK